MCPGAANAPPPSLHLHLLYSTFLPFHIHAPSPSFSPFFFSFPSTSFISLVPLFFPPDDAFSFLRFRTSPPSLFHCILLSFPSLSLFISHVFSPPFFFSNTPPDHITGRGSSQETVQTDAHISFNHIINAVCSDKAQDIKQLFMKRY